MERSAAVNAEKEIHVRKQHEHIDDRKNYEHHNVRSCNLIIFDLLPRASSGRKYTGIAS